VKLNGKTKETFGATIKEFLLRRHKNSNKRGGNNTNQGMGTKGKKVPSFTMTELCLLNLKQTKVTWSLYRHTCQILATTMKK